MMFLLGCNLKMFIFLGGGRGGLPFGGNKNLVEGGVYWSVGGFMRKFSAGGGTPPSREKPDFPK